jgi:general secretion pathway protein E
MSADQAPSLSITQPITQPTTQPTSALSTSAPATHALIAQARTLSVQQDVPFFTVLQQLSTDSSDALLQTVAKLFGYPVLLMADLQALQPDFEIVSYTDCIQRGLLIGRSAQAVRSLVPLPYCLMPYCLMPYCLVPYCLVLTNPFDAGAEDWALRRCAAVGVQAQAALAHPDDLQAFFVQQERQLRAMDGFEAGLVQHGDEEVAAVITLTTIHDDASAVVKLLNSTIYDALKLQASDIHLECDASCLHVLYRIDGVMTPITQVPGHGMAEQVISRVKVMADLDIAERRVPQDGRFKVRVNGREIDFRVSVMPNMFGEDAVLRLLDRQSLTEEASLTKEPKNLRLDNLGLDAPAISAIRRLANKPHGMLLVTGPTGSGKTTTLYGAITEIHTGRDKIITIEDPVEYRLPRVLQIPVNEKKGLTFARGLRSILRHDPDTIMVGEIRDDETAQIAVQAALTGHLVLTTVHANNVFDVLGRFLHMGVDAYSFAAALNGIVAQRLLRINCLHCSAAVVPSDDELQQARLTRQQVRGWSFKAGQGCGHCRGVGYKGRKAVAEVLVLDDTLREMIASKAPISLLKERALHNGLQPLAQAVLPWVARGETTLEEVARVTG